MTSLVAFNLIHVTLGLALGFGVALLVADAQGWRIVSSLFNRERLSTGTGCCRRPARRALRDPNGKAITHRP